MISPEYDYNEILRLGIIAIKAKIDFCVAIVDYPAKHEILYDLTEYENTIREFTGDFSL